MPRESKDQNQLQPLASSDKHEHESRKPAWNESTVLTSAKKHVFRPEPLKANKSRRRRLGRSNSSNANTNQNEGRAVAAATTNPFSIVNTSLFDPDTAC